MSATAVAKFVASEMIIATISHQMFGAGDRVPQLLRAPDLAQQREDRDERADRHHQVGAAHPVELLERRLARCRSGRGGGLAELADLLATRSLRSRRPGRISLLSAAGCRSGSASTSGRCPRPASAAATARSSPTISRRAHQQLGDVGGAPSGRRRCRSRSRSRLIADAVRAVDEHVAGVEPTVRDARRVQSRAPGARGRRGRASVTLVGIDVDGRRAGRRGGSRAARRPGPAVPATTTLGTRTRPARRAASRRPGPRRPRAGSGARVGPPSLYAR